MRTLHDAGGRQDHHEGQGGDGGLRGRAELERRRVQERRHGQRDDDLQRDQPVESKASLDETEHHGAQPFVRDVGPAPRERRVVVDLRHGVVREDEIAGLQMQEQVVVGDRRDVEGEQEQGQRHEGGRLSAPGHTGHHPWPYLSRDAMSALTVFPSTRARCRLIAAGR